MPCPSQLIQMTFIREHGLKMSKIETLVYSDLFSVEVLFMEAILVFSSIVSDTFHFYIHLWHRRFGFLRPHNILDLLLKSKIQFYLFTKRITFCSFMLGKNFLLCRLKLCGVLCLAISYVDVWSKSFPLLQYLMGSNPMFILQF